ncbi:hypothetical protein TBR22_A33500 [Luteitalea sp. TBR-22]|uniref:YceD family protein n=1 Tax=Luteitalea sp. TBR-22 TaxID=2802971 RepID=UPI001AF61BA7|nr:DUF177 domain-containing protein [Luteitalea sp. TBR-22]BCS34121.1 hypothetical protein TBR22_A33500 [Luteitalea sp. TBR-22]
MVIDLTTLPADRVPVVADLPPAALDVPADDFVVEAPVHFDGEVERGSAETYHLRGRLTATLSLSCARCAESFPFPVATDVELRFVPAAVERAGLVPAAAAGDDDGREMEDDDPSIVPYDEPRIDLAQVAREQCYLALPMKPLCREDCQGLCPHCGVNRNVATCTCENRWEDPRLAGLKSLLKDADGSAPRE